MDTNPNIVWHNATVTRQRREAQNKHCGAIIWFTGLSGSGKSTLVRAGEILEFTGITSPYEAPENSELTINTGETALEIYAQKILDEMLHRGIISPAHNTLKMLISV